MQRAILIPDSFDAVPTLSATVSVAASDTVADNAAAVGVAVGEDGEVPAALQLDRAALDSRRLFRQGGSVHRRTDRIRGSRRSRRRSAGRGRCFQGPRRGRPLCQRGQSRRGPDLRVADRGGRRRGRRCSGRRNRSCSLPVGRAEVVIEHGAGRVGHDRCPRCCRSTGERRARCTFRLHDRCLQRPVQRTSRAHVGSTYRRSLRGGRPGSRPAGRGLRSRPIDRDAVRRHHCGQRRQRRAAATGQVDVPTRGCRVTRHISRSSAKV